MRLHKLQQAFNDAIFNAGNKPIFSTIKGPSEAAKDKRLDIYRNNVFHSLTEALESLYPVIKRLVGEPFFAGTACEYIRQRPPRSAAMVHYGEDFPQFLQVFEHTATLAYLADVAHVELAWHQAYHAEDAATLSPADFSLVPVEQLQLAQIGLHPSIVLFESPYPVLKIWNQNQGDKSDADLVNLDSGGVIGCAYRPRFDVYLLEIDRATSTLLEALQQGENLATAICRAGESDATANLPEVFAFCIQKEFFTKIIRS